ncbi:oxidative stress-responsive serine-rich protein 1 isoform X1 [Hippocampus comes]|uniref:Oxidative stress-responsive serine-rich protein 1 n=1 Tax=Hippocampus comes TaxID=109280 RepID=A0A3Q2Z233_HIPCM|nr:PREDICTED: oxidative stress-responsive serine-rich protein 1 isoform X1 [Hippocampus comes]
MAPGGPEHEEETLQTAFKKLRVDADRALTAPGVPESPRVTARDPGPSKAKHGASKDNWHGSCMRKASRGASRTQRRRRSKSPILHPPRFTYSATPPPAGVLKKRTELSPTSSGGFGAVPTGAAPRRLAATVPPSELPGKDQSSSGTIREKDDADTTDFGLLSKRRGCSGLCACSHTDGDPKAWEGASSGAAPCCCASKTDAWSGTGAYSFTGLRDVISECERHGGPRPPPTRTAGLAHSPASPRSCSSQALVSVDDVTMEDLAGYMEFYLYIPKKMSHMAEMMYT